MFVLRQTGTLDGHMRTARIAWGNRTKTQASGEAFLDRWRETQLDRARVSRCAGRARQCEASSRGDSSTCAHAFRKSTGFMNEHVAQSQYRFSLMPPGNCTSGGGKSLLSRGAYPKALSPGAARARSSHFRLTRRLLRRQRDICFVMSAGCFVYPRSIK